MAINVSQIPTFEPYSSNEVNLLNASSVEATFNPSINYIEYIITDSNNSFKIVDEQYNNYSFPTDGTVTSDFISSINFDPLNDVRNLNLNVGNYITYYNFFQNEANTTPYNKNIFVKEISADRTEVVVGFLSLSTSSQSIVDSLKINNSDYFKEFYLNFGNGVICLANNIQVSSNSTLTINLYEPLPSNISINAAFWIVTKIADTLSFAVNITPDPYVPPVFSLNIKSPNFNLPTRDQTNNSTGYLDYNTLLQIQSISSSNQIKSLLSSSGININIDYTDFKNFIHFSSAYQRLENFYYKVSQIESLTNQINNWSSVTNSSSSINNLQSQITSIITNFDDYDYYLYYNSGSWAWPKSNNALPYTLYSTGSIQVTNWLGNGENLTGILGSASIYDERNQDNLYYSIPSYIRDDERNAPYYLFIEMMGQHYDGIWTYYKDVTNLHQADNRLDYGISKDLVAEALKSFGLKIYQNNFTSNDLYSSFLGYTSNNIDITGSLPVTTGSFQDYINNYVTASYEASINPLDDYNKEIYKRIYHNLPYLAKTKGTIPGLRALINCFGVPDTILRISEFGGRDKDTSTYDYFDQQFNYAAIANSSAKISTPWFLASAWSSSINNFKASSVQFRFKTSDFDTGSNYQMWGISTSGTGTYPSSSLVIKYSGSGLITSSYSGSTLNPYYQHAYLTFYPKTNDIVNTASVYLPFFNHNWWSIMINKFGDTYTLYAGDKLYYDGYDGNQIGYLASSSITLANTLWTGSGTSTFLSSSVSIGGTTYNKFTGSLQEIRYWIKTGSVDSFKDFIMNPQSIDYSGEVLYDDYLAFRLPLGGDLYTGSQSVHPRWTGSWASTSSFIASNNATLTNVTFEPNVETRFLNSPIIGLRGRVTDKIQIVSSSLPTGSVLSQYTSIEQSYPSLGSESPDVNMLEVAFSPQNEINDDIIDSLGYFNIGEYIGDPRQVSSSATSYPDLNALSNNFFQKYFDSYDLNDYVRLIKYFDNSLFKMIKDFVPARTSLTTGVVIKQHLLERNKYPQPQIYDTQYQNLNVYSSSLGLSSSFNYGEDLTYEGTIDTAFMDGSTGGTFDQYNILKSYQSYPFTIVGSNFIIDPETPINYFVVSSSVCTITTNIPINNNFSWDPSTGEIITYFYGKIQLFAFGTNSPSGNSLNLYFSSSQNNVVATNTVSNSIWAYNTNVIDCSYGERFSLWIADGGGGPNTSSIQFGLYSIYPYSNQTWTQNYTGSTGVSTIIHSTQDEFYNGELPGSEYIVTNGELNPNNEFKYPTTLEIYYDPTLYLSSITSKEDFLNINTSPNQGEIYLWFDTGSVSLGPGDQTGGGGNIG
jgi:hypothetical protein